jgi:hypothetical protein
MEKTRKKVYASKGKKLRNRERGPNIFSSEVFEQGLSFERKLPKRLSNASLKVHILSD